MNSKRVLFFAGSLLFLFAVLLVWNLWQYSQQSNQAGEYLPSRLEWVSLPQKARLHQPVEIVWRVTAPTPRQAVRTALFWGEQSTPSAQLELPNETPYPHFTPDYWQGPFALPDQFEVVLIPTSLRPL